MVELLTTVSQKHLIFMADSWYCIQRKHVQQLHVIQGITKQLVGHQYIVLDTEHGRDDTQYVYKVSLLSCFLTEVYTIFTTKFILLFHNCFFFHTSQQKDTQVTHE